MNNKTGITQDTLRTNPDSTLSLLEIAVLAAAVAGALYFGYFQLSPWIWSQSLPYQPEEIMQWSLPWLEDRDGIELYALYTLMYLNLLSLCALSYGWSRLFNRRVRYLLVLPLAAVAIAFIASIGFHPPMSELADRTASEILLRSFTVIAVMLPVIALLYYSQQRSAFWTLAVAALLLIPVCFISTQPFFWRDYYYVFAPAFRLLHGAELPEIYFQYDLLLSLVGLAWMKLKLDLNLFQVIGQASYYLLLLGIFAFSRRWFLDKRLAVFLLVALVLVRIYAGPFDAVYSFQVTPLRLDLWLILLALVYFKGPHHWSAGLFCGLLLLLHFNFGLIYSAAYVQLLLTLCVIDTAMIPGRMLITAWSTMIRFFMLNHRTLALMLMGALAHYLLFRSPDVQSELDFYNLRLGFTKIARDSFYWYVVAMPGLTFVLLLRLRSVLSSSYLAAGFLLIFLAIGNSLYFFGRSHENNIINISAALLLLFFLMLDLAGRYLDEGRNGPAKSFILRNWGVGISLALIASITIWYGDRITYKAGAQAQNAGKGQFIYPSEIPEQSVMSVIAYIKSVTAGDSKVYFVNENGFLLGYYGGYAPVGYYNPLDAWVSRSEFNKFLQGLLDQGYYLVVDNNLAEEVLPSVSFINQTGMGGLLVIWK